MKYYLYISDSKVDMLFPQVPHEVKKKTAAEFGFDLKLFKASRKSEQETDESRISRLEAVVSFIREYGRVGSIDDPDDFIDDTQKMWFGNSDDEDIVYLTGATNRAIFGLAGSAKNLIGKNMGDKAWCSYSEINSITRWLRSAERDGGSTAEPGNSVLRRMYSLAMQDLQSSHVPKQRLEFFAKRLFFEPKFAPWEDEPDFQMILASPLYIAMTD